MSKSYCPLPWMFQAVRNNGDYRICCQANVSAGRGLLRHLDGRTANAAHDAPSEVRNLPLLKEARKLMLAGQWPESCVRCQREEASGLRSRRIYENENWHRQLPFDKASALTEADGSLRLPESPLLSLDLRFGNKCNLKCRMCGPADSDFWYGDHVALEGPSFRDTQGVVQLTQNQNGKWVSSDPGYVWYEEGASFWQEIEAGLADLRHLHIVGGEPLLLERHYDLLKMLVKSEQSHHITLEYNTNLTVLPDQILELWRSFEQVRVGVSLDGVGAMNDYIRHPSKWAVIERNLHRLDAAEGPIEGWISTTVQIYNAFHLTELIDWRLRAGFRRLNRSQQRPIVTSHPVHRPLWLTLRALPKPLKQKVQDHYGKFCGELNQHAENWTHPHVDLSTLKQKIGELLDGYVHFMNQEDLSSHYPDFLRQSQRLDVLRGQNLAEICPELELPETPAPIELSLSPN